MAGQRCRFMEGDALQKMKELTDRSVDHCITDPPYNVSYRGKKKIGWLQTNSMWTDEKKFSKMDAEWDSFSESGYESFTKMWLSEAARVTKPNGNIMVFGTFHNIYTIGHTLKQLGMKINGSITWYKRNAFPNITRRMLCESTEYVIWAVNNDPKAAKNWVFNYDVLKEINDGKQMRNVWDVPLTPRSEKAFGKHPNQKPLEVCRRLVLGMTNPGDVVLDPFAGSATIPLVAKMQGRRYIAIEKELEFAAIAKKRLDSVP